MSWRKASNYQMLFLCTTSPNTDRRVVLRWSWSGGTTRPTAAGRPSSPTRTLSRTSWSACCVCAAALLSPSERSWKEACPSSASCTFMEASSPSAAEIPASSSIRWLRRQTQTQVMTSLSEHLDARPAVNLIVFSPTLLDITAGLRLLRAQKKKTEINYKMRQTCSENWFTQS